MKQSPFVRGLIVVLAATLIVGGLVFSNRILAGDIFEKEEAQHALYGFWLWRDIQSLDWGSFWHDTERQMFWPFLHSWILSLFFLVFGVSYITARSLSLLFFVLSIIMVYALSNKISEKSGWRIGIISVLLMLTSPLMIKYASLNMLEGLGSFLFLSCAYVYLKAEERKDLLHYFFLAFLMSLSIYTNYIYAFLLLPAFLVGTTADLGPIFYKAYDLRRKGEKAAMQFAWWGYKKLISLLVILILAGIWFSFSFSRKVTFFLDAIFKNWGGVMVNGPWEVVAYYPRVIIERATFSPWLGGLLLFSLVLPFVATRYQGLNKIFIFVWTVLLLITLTVTTKAPSMVYIIIPFIFLIFSATAIYFYDYFAAKNRKYAQALLLIVLLPALLSLPTAYRLYFPSRTGENMIQVLEYFRGSVPEDKSIAIPLNLKHLNPESVQFHFRERAGEVLTDPQMAEERSIDKERYYLTIELDERSNYRDGIKDDSLYQWNSWIWSSEMNGEIRFYSSRRFGKIGLTAKIFKFTP